MIMPNALRGLWFSNNSYLYFALPSALRGSRSTPTQAQRPGGEALSLSLFHSLSSSLILSLILSLSALAAASLKKELSLVFPRQTHTLPAR